MDVAQSLEDILEELALIQKEIKKLTTESVSGQALRNKIKNAHKSWLPIAGLLEAGNIVDHSQIKEVSDAWSVVGKLADKASAKALYKVQLKTIITKTEYELLHKYIKCTSRDPI